MSSIKINEKPIKGNKKNNTLVNKQIGLTAMYGYAGNDKYIINNISNSFTLISDKSGKDSLHIKNINGNNLIFMFDIATGDNKKPGDELEIFQKNKLETIAKQLTTFAETNDKYDMPKGGIIGINDYMGNTNNIQADGKYGSNFGNGYIEKIYTTNSTGTEYVLNVKSYIKKFTPILNDFYEKNKTLIEQEDEATEKQLINLYKKAPINMKITGSKKADKILSGNGTDKIYANAGNDTIKSAGGNDIIKADKGNDRIYAGAGNDKIYGGKGNDIIDAGTGKNYIYIAKDDGDDIIKNGKGIDTIIFKDEKFKNIKLKFSKEDLVISHSGDKVTLKNYKKVNHSAQYIKIGNTKKSIDSLLHSPKFTNNIKSFKSSDELSIDAIRADVANWTSTTNDGISDIVSAMNDTNIDNATITTFINDQYNPNIIG